MSENLRREVRVIGVDHQPFPRRSSLVGPPSLPVRSPPEINVRQTWRLSSLAPARRQRRRGLACQDAQADLYSSSHSPSRRNPWKSARAGAPHGPAPRPQRSV